MVASNMGERKQELHRRAQKKKTTRDAIFKTAQKLFNKQGFENTSVEDITKRIHIAQSTFFNYYPRKEDILIEIFQKKLPALKKQWKAIIESHDPIITKIDSLFSSTVHVAARNENISRAILINNISSLNRQYDRVFFEEFRICLSFILEKGQESGQIRSDIPALKLAAILEGVFNLFVIDCLVKRLCSITSNELYERLNICLEGMLSAAAAKQ